MFVYPSGANRGKWNCSTQLWKLEDEIRYWKKDAVFTVTYRGFCVSCFTSWSCTGGGVRIMTLLAYLSSQPAVKVSLLQLLKTRLVINMKSLLKISVESHLCKRIKKLTDFVYFLFTVGMLRTMTCCFPVSCRPCCHVWRAPQKISWCPDLSIVLWYGTLFPVISRSILKILISSSVWKWSIASLVLNSVQCSKMYSIRT